MQTKITIRNEAQTCYIDIEGTIGVPEQYQFENASSRVATFETFRREVARISEVAATSVVVNIRSTGGDVNDALLIYEALQSLDARITTRCYGYTASAATIIAQAADKGCREISSNALYLIHNSMCAIEGNASTLESRAELLRKTDERLAHLYAQHSERDAQMFVELMAENNGEGRWLTAEETVEAGLADRIIDNLITGSLLPDEDGQAGGQTGGQTGGETPQEPTPTVDPTPQNKAAACEKQDVKRALNRAAGALLGYLLRRFSYRWEQWMDNIRQKREQRDSEQTNQSTQTYHTVQGAPNGEGTAGASATLIAPTSATTPVTSGEGGNAESLPQAAAQRQAANARSSILFSEGQRRYQPSRVKPTEDPSVNKPHYGSNLSAYAEDAKAFGRY